MSSFQCSFCDRTFSTCNGLSKHMSKCTHKITVDEFIAPICSDIIDMGPIDCKNVLDDFDYNENTLHKGSSSKKISFKDINFRSTSNVCNDIDIVENFDHYLYEAPPNISIIKDSFEFSDEMSFELEENTNL